MDINWLETTGIKCYVFENYRNIEGIRFAGIKSCKPHYINLGKETYSADITMIHPKELYFEIGEYQVSLSDIQRYIPIVARKAAEASEEGRGLEWLNGMTSFPRMADKMRKSEILLASAFTYVGNWAYDREVKKVIMGSISGFSFMTTGNEFVADAHGTITIDTDYREKENYLEIHSVKMSNLDCYERSYYKYHK